MITKKELDQIMAYNPETGIFTWLVEKNSYRGKTKIGAPVGHKQQNGYVMTRINGVPYLLHRLAFIAMGQEIDGMEVDHINHLRDDNRWENMRAVSARQNKKNGTLRSDNTSGHVGVFWCKSNKAWVARIFMTKENGKRYCKSLGYYKNKEDAVAARESANAAHGFHANHGMEKQKEAC